MEIEDWRDSGDFVAALGHVSLLRLETFIDDPADALRAAGLGDRADSPAG